MPHYFQLTLDRLRFLDEVRPRERKPSAATYAALDLHAQNMSPPPRAQSEVRKHARNQSRPWRYNMYTSAMRIVGQHLAKEPEVRDTPPAKRDPVRMHDLVREAARIAGDDLYASHIIEIALALCGQRLAFPRWEQLDDNFQRSEGDEEAWRQLPWASESWCTLGHKRMHLPHMSQSKKGMVAFAETPAKLVANRFTITRPGRYLQRFFGHVLDGDAIKMWAERFEAMENGTSLTLHYVAGDDRDEWVRVYRDGPESCMSGDESPFIAPYAHKHSVLRLAVAEQFDRIVGRAIVREDRKEFVRVYPNPNNDEARVIQRQFADMLIADGYKHGTLEGVLLDAIELRENCYVSPYVDCGTGPHLCGELVTNDQGTYIRLGSKGPSMCNTGGEVWFGSRVDQIECSDCNEDFDEDDDNIQYHDHIGRYVCQQCLRYGDYVLAYVGRYDREWMVTDDAVYCDDTEEYYDDDDTAERHGVFRCEHSGDLFHRDNMVETERGWIHDDHAVALDVPDPDGNEYAHEDDVSTTYDGRVIHDDDAVIVGTDNFGVSIVAHKDDAVAQRLAA